MSILRLSKHLKKIHYWTFFFFIYISMYMYMWREHRLLFFFSLDCCCHIDLVEKKKIKECFWVINDIDNSYIIMNISIKIGISRRTTSWIVYYVRLPPIIYMHAIKWMPKCEKWKRQAQYNNNHTQWHIFHCTTHSLNDSLRK